MMIVVGARGSSSSTGNAPVPQATLTIPTTREKKRKCTSDALLSFIAFIAAETILLNLGWNPDNIKTQILPISKYQDPLFHGSQSTFKFAGSESRVFSASRTRSVADGTFNGYPVYYHDLSNITNASSSSYGEFYSTVHCVGENYQPSAWMHRSCHYSSSIKNRRIDFTFQMESLKAAFANSSLDVVVEGYTFHKHSLQEQMEVASSAAIFITGCGGGAVTAMFLPRGAAVLLYFVSDGGVSKNHRTFTPARLDWDLFNHLAYLHVHRIPRYTMTLVEESAMLIELVTYELTRIEQQND